MTFTDILTRTAKRDALIYSAVIADNTCFSYDDGRAMVDKKAFSDLRSGVYFNSCETARHLTDKARSINPTARLQSMRNTIKQQCMKSGIKRQHFKIVDCSGITLTYWWNFVFYIFNNFDSFVFCYAELSDKLIGINVEIQIHAYTPW